MIRNIDAYGLGLDGGIRPQPQRQDMRVNAATVSYDAEAAKAATSHRKHYVKADASTGFGGGGGGGAPTSGGFGVTGSGVNSAYVLGVLERFLQETPQILRRIYRDIYYNDHGSQSYGHSDGIDETGTE